MLNRAPRIEPWDETTDMELDEDEVESLAGESTLAETPVPIETQSREVYRLADDNAARPDEPAILAMRALETNELMPPSIEDDDESEGPAVDEELELRVRPERHRHKNKRRRA